MHTPTLTPEKIAELTAVQFPSSLNWVGRRLARLKQQYSNLLALKEKCFATAEEGYTEITLRSAFQSVTIPAHQLRTSIDQDLSFWFKDREKELVAQILEAQNEYDTADGEHAQDMNDADASARREVLQLCLPAADFAAFVGPTLAPTGRTIPMVASTTAQTDAAA
jgi:hypothetical protein